MKSTDRFQLRNDACECTAAVPQPLSPVGAGSENSFVARFGGAICLKCWQNDGGHVDVREMYIFYEQKSDGSQVKKFFCLQFVRVGLLINHHDMNMH